MGFLEYHPKDNMIRIALLACTAALAAADADALYGYAGHHLGHLGYAGHHVVHAAPVHHAVHAVHAVPVHHAVQGVTNVANTVGIHGVAPAAIPAVHGAYAGAGRYVANSAGVVHVAKREAEPEADAEAFTIPMEDMALDTVSILLDMDMVMVIMLDSATLLLAMVMVMVLDIPGTMESVKPRLSQRLMPSMEPTDTVMDLDTVPTPLD